MDGLSRLVGACGGSSNHPIASVIGERGCCAIPCCAGEAVLGIVGVGGVGESCLVSVGIEGDSFASDLRVGISGGDSLFESLWRMVIHGSLEIRGYLTAVKPDLGNFSVLRAGRK